MHLYGKPIANQISRHLQLSNTQSLVQTCAVQNFNPKSELKYCYKLMKDTIQLSNPLKKAIDEVKDDDYLRYFSRDTKFLKSSRQDLYNILKVGEFSPRQTKQAEKVLYKIDSSLEDYVVDTEGLSLYSSPDYTIDEYGDYALDACGKFLNAFDEMLFPKSKNKKVIKIENKLKELGVNARLTDHEEEARAILEGYEKMYKFGIRQFPKIRVAVAGWIDNHANPSLIEKYQHIIYSSKIINEKDKTKKGFHSVAWPRGVVYHEMGHILNKHLGFSSRIQVDILEDFHKIARELDFETTISRYSTTDSHEFASEVFAKMMNDEEIDERALKYYVNDLNGYIPPKLRDKILSIINKEN